MRPSRYSVNEAARLTGLSRDLLITPGKDMDAMLTHTQIAITDQERDDMLAVARQMEIDNRVSDALSSCPHAG
jgi:hypothetical protein